MTESRRLFNEVGQYMKEGLPLHVQWLAEPIRLWANSQNSDTPLGASMPLSLTRFYVWRRQKLK